MATRPRRRLWRLAVIFLASALLTYYGLMFAAYDFDRHFLAIDRCLDAGGRWDRALTRCDFRIPDAGDALWQRDDSIAE